MISRELELLKKVVDDNIQYLNPSDHHDDFMFLSRCIVELNDKINNLFDKDISKSIDYKLDIDYVVKLCEGINMAVSRRGIDKNDFYSGCINTLSYCVISLSNNIKELKKFCKIED